jgi:hypothetical protein
VTLAQRMQKLDYRWIWLIAMAIVWASVLAPVSLPIPVQPSTRQALAWIDSLPPGSVLFIAPEYSPGADAELNPQVRVVAIAAFRHGLRLVIGGSGGNSVLGVQEAEAMVEQAAQLVGGKRYGVDWVNIGYKPGGAAAENQLTRNFQQGSLGVDWQGKPLASFPLTKNIKALDSRYFSGIWAEDTGTPGCPDWYANSAVPGNLPLACGAITMEIPNFAPYVQAGQFKALLGGARGAAEMEDLLNAPGLGLASQETATIASVFILALIVLGNVAYFGTRRGKAG